MAISKFGLLKLILREAISADRLKRCPEPACVMEDPENVESFHIQGDAGGALVPVYHFNALAINALLPYNGRIVDLGCGSGQFLRYLARFRPDCRISGLDLSQEMVNIGNLALKEAGLERVARLEIGDMTRFSAQISGKVDVVSSIFALHHLASFEDLLRCLVEIRTVQERHDCGVWIFDHTRPRSTETAEVFPEIFTPEATARFRRDSTNSLLASFSFKELSEQLDSTFPEKFQHECSRLLKLYQIHWLNQRSGQEQKPQAVSCDTPMLPEESRSFRQLRSLFNKAPF